MAQIRQSTAAILRRQHLDGLAARRIETAKLRTLCTWIAATMQVDPEDNTMLTAAADITLGPGTETPGGPPDTPTPSATVPTAAAVPGGPTAVLDLATLPDAPTSRRAGDPAPVPAHAHALRLEEVGTLFGGM